LNINALNYILRNLNIFMAMKTFTPPIKYDYARKRITEFIRDKVAEASAEGVVIGLSGGVDSSVTLALAVEALGEERVHGLVLPDTRVTPQEDIDDALNIANKFGIKVSRVDIDSIVDSFKKAMPFYRPEDKVSLGNVRARVRMTILYYYANAHNLLVCGTGDKSEIYMGYFTKYGDGGADLLPIGDLFKTQVRELGRQLGVPEKILRKPSSPRLWEDQTAEGELGATYEVIDTVLFYYLNLKMEPQQINKETGIPIDLIERIVDRIYRFEHKRNMPPIAKLSVVTVGLDWKMPHKKE